MDLDLLTAAINGNVDEMKRLVNDNEEVLRGTTKQGSNCLHIAAIYGHTDFCTEVLQRINNSRGRSSDLSSLLSDTNNYGETPLLTAVKNGRESLVRELLLPSEYVRMGLQDALRSRDEHGSNVLHYAIRNGNKNLALQLIREEPALSGCRNNNNESPMFIAVLRGLDEVYAELLRTEGSADSGTNASNALHAAVKYNRVGKIYEPKIHGRLMQVL